MVKIGPTYSARITVSNDVVTKKILVGSIPGRSKKSYKELFDREIWALNLLQNEPHFPDLLSYDTDRLEFKSSWCGEPIKSLPVNWKEQASKIVESLNTIGILHLDIALKNITYLNGIIYLLDFGKCRPLRADLDFPKVKISNKKANNEEIIEVLHGRNTRVRGVG